MKIRTTIALVGAVALVGYYLTAAFIVARTGSTAGISDLARGAAQIITALLCGGDNSQ